MEYTFECLVLKNNQLVKENIIRPISDVSEELKEIMIFLNNSSKWLESISIDEFKKILKTLPISVEYHWKDIYPNYLQENITPETIISDNLEFKAKIKYNSAKFEKCEWLINCLKNLIPIESLNDYEWELIAMSIYKEFDKILTDEISHYSGKIKISIYDILRVTDDIKFIKPRTIHFSRSHSFEIDEFQIVWNKYDGYMYESKDNVSFYLKGKRKLTFFSNKLIEESFDGLFTKNSNQTIKLINYFLSNRMEFIKEYFIKNQICALKNALELEESELKYLIINELPTAGNRVIDLKKQLELITNTDSKEYTDLKSELEKTTTIINQYKLLTEYISDPLLSIMKSISGKA